MFPVILVAHPGAKRDVMSVVVLVLEHAVHHIDMIRHGRLEDFSALKTLDHWSPPLEERAGLRGHGPEPGPQKGGRWPAEDLQRECKSITALLP